MNHAEHSLLTVMIFADQVHPDQIKFVDPNSVYVKGHILPPVCGSDLKVSDPADLTIPEFSAFCFSDQDVLNWKSGGIVFNRTGAAFCKFPLRKNGSHSEIEIIKLEVI